MDYFVEIKFEKGNKFYNFSCETPDLLPGDKVVVETVRGIELGEVARKPQPMSNYKSTLELKPIVRAATKADLEFYKANLTLAEDAKKVFLYNIEKLNLQMRFIDASYTLDGTKCIFTYVSDDRIDFRDLLKVLAGTLKCKIELRQIGSRDKAMLYGGLGPCGRPICCSLFLTEFNGISINKAKNQMLTLNIPKLTGQCGKLMCCLNYENDAYDELKAQFPEIGTKFMVNDIEFTVNTYNVFSKIVKCTSSEGDVFLPLNDLLDQINGVKKPAKPQQKVEFANINEEKSVKKDNQNNKQNKQDKKQKKEQKLEKKDNKASQNKQEKVEKKQEKQERKEDKKNFKNRNNHNNKHRNFNKNNRNENQKDNSQNKSDAPRKENHNHGNNNHRKFVNKNRNHNNKNRNEKKDA